MPQCKMLKDLDVRVGSEIEIKSGQFDGEKAVMVGYRLDSVQKVDPRSVSTKNAKVVSIIVNTEDEWGVTLPLETLACKI